MGSSPGFGSHRRDSSPLRTRFRSGSACPWLNLATPMHSSAHSTKGTPSPHCSTAEGSDRPEAHGFRCSFTPLKRGTFHHSLTVLVPYRSPMVFSLGWWSTPLPTRYHVSGGTHAQVARPVPTRRLRGSHPLRRPVPAAFGCASTSTRGVCRPLPTRRSTPFWQHQQATNTKTVWALPRSLAATEGILSFPRGTEMFQFPRCPLLVA